MHTGKLAILSLSAVLSCFAQDKINVPLSNASQPVTIKATLMSGNITVTAVNGPEVVVTATDIRGNRKKANEEIPPGMKLIGGRQPLDIQEDHNVITIQSGSPFGGGDLTIQTPVNTSLQIKTMNGRSVTITGVNGDQEIETTNGTIQMTNISGSVVAHAVNGGVNVNLDRVSSKPMSFTSLNGKVDVTLPADTKARLRLKSDNGSIYSDFDVKMEPDASKPVIEDSRNIGGRYRIRVDRAVTGTINGGGPEYTFQTMNGNILIHKK